MKGFITLFMLFAVVYSIWGIKACSDEGPTNTSGVATVTAVETPPVRKAVTKNPNGRDLGKTDELVRAVSETYGVPAGALYGVWMAETGGLTKDWGTGDGWQQPSSYSQGKPCFARLGVAKCATGNAAVIAVCGQRRNGMPACDPAAVRVADAFAMGPLRIPVSRILAARPDGTTAWNPAFAEDFDGDGVIDPHSLADALAMAARHLRASYEEARKTMPEVQAWERAVSRYRDDAPTGYYEGSPGSPGVRFHWQQWCATRGSCG